MREDLRSTFRQIRRNPVFASAVILTLALGVGANTAIFSIVDSLLLKPLPVREPHALVAVASADTGDAVFLSYPVWKSIRSLPAFEGAFAWAADRVGVSDGSETRTAHAIWATGNIFDVLGVRTAHGRTFTGADDRRGAPPVAVISHAFWQSRFGGGADAIGQTLAIDRARFTIVGVLPRGFFGLDVGDAIDVMFPLESEPLLGRTPKRLDSPNWTWLRVMARLAPNQTPQSLTGALLSAQPEIRTATMPPFTHAEDRERYLRAPWIVRAAPSGVSRLRRQYGAALLILLGIVGVVLLVACANIATLLLGRAATRRFEFSVRRALGASSGRLFRLLLLESLLLSAIGGAAGLVLAQWGSRLLVRQLSTWYSDAFLDLSIDWRVVAVTAAATVISAALFGAGPAVRALRVPPIDALKRRPGGMAGGTILGAGGGLVVVQIALSLVLVAGAGLFVRSFSALAYRDLGFDRDRVLVAVIEAGRSATPPADRAALYERVRESVAGLPGVESAAASMATPLGNAGVRMTPDIAVPGSAASEEATRILTTPVSPDWFRTFGTRLLAGRDFNARDGAGAAGVVIANQAFARRYFDGAVPVGRTVIEVISSTERRPLEIVGLVEDAAFVSVRDRIEPALYRPLAQRLDEKLLTAVPTVSVSVRAAPGTRPSRLTATVASAIGGVDRNLSVSFLTVAQQLNAFYIRERLLAMLSGFFGVLAMVLTALGLYGVTWHAVSRRRTEIGIRLALGARPAAVVRMVLARLTLLTAIGIAVGATLALWATRFIGSQLFSVPARDPVTFAVAAAVLVIVAGAAGWVPARRAARVDPAVVLREQ